MPRLDRHVARDRDNIQLSDSRPSGDASNILRLMTNLFTFSHTPRRVSELPNSVAGSSQSLPARVDAASAKDASDVDVSAAEQYAFPAGNPVYALRKNTEVARQRGRSDHERIFSLLTAILGSTSSSEYESMGMVQSDTGREMLALLAVRKLYEELLLSKDIQMLAVVSVLLLRLTPSSANTSRNRIDSSSPAQSKRSREGLSISPVWTGASSSPISSQPIAPPLSSPSLSRGSWSSLFTASSMRQFVGGSKTRTGIPVPEGNREEVPAQPSHRRDSVVTLPTPATKSSSWSEATTAVPVASAISFSSVGHMKRTPSSLVLSARPITMDRKRISAHFVVHSQPSSRVLEPEFRGQLLNHILSYAEMLLAWGLPLKRTELLKSVEAEISSTRLQHEDGLGLEPLGCVPVCVHGLSDEPGFGGCERCAKRPKQVRCSICRLPVKGISYVCSGCRHVAHVPCWDARRDVAVACATGCGCECDRFGRARRIPNHDRSLASQQMPEPG